LGGKTSARKDKKRIMTLKRAFGLGLKFSISIALIWVLLDKVGVGEAMARLLSVHPGWLALAAVIAMVQVLICTCRWQAVLGGLYVSIGYKKAFKFWYIGAFFNQALPSSAGGDVVRGYLAYKDGMGLAPVLSSLFLDRAVTVLALVVLVASMTPFATLTLENDRWFIHAVFILLSGCVMGLMMIMLLDSTPGAWTKFRVVKAMHHLAGDTRRVLLHPWTASQVMVWSILGHINLVLVVYVLFRGVGVDLSLVDCLLLFPPVLLVQVLPISIAGWGVREGAMVAVFALVGVSSEAALAVSILYGLVLMVTSFPGAVLWLGSNAPADTKDIEAFAESVNQQ